MPVFLPQRITPELVAMLRQYHPLWMNIHVNHPKEITPELRDGPGPAGRRRHPAGQPDACCWPASTTRSQVIQELVHKLVRNRVRPYYLYQCDLVEGAGHFRTTVSKGIEIIEGLRGHTSGYAIPTYVVDAPGGGGKIPVMPQYLISQAPGKVVLRNYEGYITTYDEPIDYTGHTVARPERPCRRRGRCGGRLRAARGAAEHIKPQGFDKTHRRNADAARDRGPIGQGRLGVDPGPASRREAGRNGNGHDGNGA